MKVVNLLILFLLAHQACTVVAFQPCPPEAKVLQPWRTYSSQNGKPSMLWSKGLSDEERLEAKRRSERINGTGAEGKTLLALGLLLSVWLFTVPPDEFRRKNICSEADTALYPDICITTGQLGQKVVDYYKNGGGIKWDFTVGEGTKANLERWQQ